jgi:hypothetical protein
MAFKYGISPKKGAKIPLKKKKNCYVAKKGSNTIVAVANLIFVKILQPNLPNHKKTCKIAITSCLMLL